MAPKVRQVTTGSYVKFNFLVLQLLGIWNPYDHGIPFWLFRLYMMIIFTIITVGYTILEIFDAIVVKDDLQLLTENIYSTLSHLTAVAKIIHLWMEKSKINGIVDILERVLRQEDDGAMGSTQEILVGQAIRRGTMITKAFVIFALFAAIANMVFPIWDQSYKEGKLPYNWYFYPISMNSSIHYWTSYTYMGVCVTWQAWSIITHDTFFITLMIHAIAQINILKSKIETVCDNFEVGNFPEKSEDEIGDICSDKILSRFTVVASELPANDESTKNLKSCIEDHQNIIRLVSELESMFSNVILMQFGASLISIGVTGFQVSVNAGNGRLIPVIGNLLCMLFQLLLYCWYGNEIILQSGSLGSSAYACSWYEEKLKFSGMLKIFMVRTQKPLVITAGNFCPLSLETFVSILTTSYSYIAVLNRLNG